MMRSAIFLFLLPAAILVQSCSTTAPSDSDTCRLRAFVAPEGRNEFVYACQILDASGAETGPATYDSLVVNLVGDVSSQGSSILNMLYRNGRFVTAWNATINLTAYSDVIPSNAASLVNPDTHAPGPFGVVLSCDAALPPSSGSALADSLPMIDSAGHLSMVPVTYAWSASGTVARGKDTSGRATCTVTMIVNDGITLPTASTWTFADGRTSQMFRKTITRVYTDGRGMTSERIVSESLDATGPRTLDIRARTLVVR